jgi:hypothetical protein
VLAFDRCHEAQQAQGAGANTAGTPAVAFSLSPISHDLSISRLAISAAGWALHAIAPAALGTIERLIAGFEERSNCQRAHPSLVRGHADTC